MMTQEQRFIRQGGTSRIKLPDRFDVASSIELRIPFVRLLGDDSTTRLVVDLSGMRYIDSMGVGTLLSWDRCCKGRGKAMELECCDPSIMKMMKIAGVHRLFKYSTPGT